MNTKYLVAVADTHGNNEALRKISGFLRTLLERYDKPLNDCAILYLGDALPLEKMPEKDVADHYKRFTDALANAELPVIGVGGSFDIADAIRKAFEEKGWAFLHGETAEWNGLKFAGYGGSQLKPEAAEEELGLPKEKFVQFNDMDLVKRLQDKEIDIFLHHTMPYGFADQIAVGGQMTAQGLVVARMSIGAKSINHVLSKTNPILDISGHIHERTASATEQRTVFIKCHGFQGEYGFPVYYVEIAYDQDGKPFVKSNVDISFQIDGFAQLAPRPIVTCREEYECTSKEMVQHYRIMKNQEDSTIIKAIKTEDGFRAVSQKPALLGSDDISWAFVNDKEDGSTTGRTGGGIVLL
jgi:Icc-related predicted phosphoesterase